MSTEASPLNPDHGEHDDDDSICLETRKAKDPLYVSIFYALSLAVSIGGFACTIWGYIIVRNTPFDESSRKMERQGYEKYFYGMQSIWVLHGINIFWSGLNLRLALKGKQNDIWPLNMVYDFGIWALLIAFGVLNMVTMLWDRRLCDGWYKDEETYKKCDVQMFRLLVVELVAVNLGLLVAVLHFILLVARCCTQGRRNDIERSLSLQKRIREEEGTLLRLMERRSQLLQENETLETRWRNERSLPEVPAEDIDGDGHKGDSTERDAEEDLIDMTAHSAGFVVASSSDPPNGETNSAKEVVPGVQVPAEASTQSI